SGSARIFPSPLSACPTTESRVGGPHRIARNARTGHHGDVVYSGRAVKTDLLSTRQVAELLGVAEATVKRWADAGESDCFRMRGHELAEIFDDVVAPALTRIGDAWQQCKLSVAEEHVAAQAVIDAISRSQPLAESPGEPVRGGRWTAVVAAAAGEQHDIAAR